jgi:pimeloyl-ACP methyl ester carboxylesterase
MLRIVHKRFLRLALILIAFATPPAHAAETSPSTGTVNSADGVPIVYDRYGTSRSTLILVHGWSCDRSYWEAQAAALAYSFTVVTLDLAGHGESGVDRGDWTIASFGADVAAVAERLQMENIILVGHSMGGDVILEAARRLPGRVRGLVWVDTYKELPSRRTAGQLESFIGTLQNDFPGATKEVVRSMFVAESNPELVERVATDMASAPPAIAVPSVRSALMYANEVPAVLKELDLPVFAINPEQPASNMQALSQYNVEVLTIPRVGHFLMMENPGEFNTILAEVAHRMLAE